jgi:hypothetical protein
VTLPHGAVIRDADLQEDAMNQVVLRLFVQVPALVLLAACAANHSPSIAEQEVDQKRVGAIDAAARHVGVSVYWINYPRKTGP